MEGTIKSLKHQTMKWLLSSLLFLIIVVLLIVGLGKVMQDKTSKTNVTPIYDIDAKYDVVFAGTSHVVSSLFPMVMWENNGIASCNYAQTGQPFPLTYYSIKEALDVTEPELIVCDLYYVYIGNKMAGNTSYKHQTLDNMRFYSPARISAIMDVVDNAEKTNFLFPFFAYHSRWNKMLQRDFKEVTSYSKGSGEVFSKKEEEFGSPFIPISRDEVKKPSSAIVHYIDSIIQLCKEKDVKLLFTVVPYYPVGEEQGRVLEDDQRLFNWVEDYVEKQGIECLNMLYLIDDMGFDMEAHMREWNHQNYWGGEVTSKYLANYIQEHYGIADHRGEVGYEQWEEDFVRYDKWRTTQLKKSK